MIVVVDYGLGNIGSIINAMEKLGVPAEISSDKDVIKRASGLVFPGDGAAGQAMRNLVVRKLVGPITDSISSGKPFLGICLGMQILLTESEEGNIKCLDIIKGKVKKYNTGIKTPQIGWNRMELMSNESRMMNKLFNDISEDSYFYFINSYYCEPADKTIIMATTDYYGEFCSIFVKENILGVQFHPEKSADAGFQLLKNWTKLC